MPTYVYIHMQPFAFYSAVHSFIKFSFLIFTSNLDIEYFFHLLFGADHTEMQKAHAYEHDLILLIYLIKLIVDLSNRVINCTQMYIFIQIAEYEKNACIRNKMPHIITHNQLFILVLCVFCTKGNEIIYLTASAATTTTKATQC